MIYYEVNL